MIVEGTMPQGGKFEDLRGRVFTRLTVISFHGWFIELGGTRKSMWVCQCECGKTHIVKAGKLKNGDTTSCGCRQKEVCRAVNVTHGARKQGGSPTEYQIWSAMKGRVINTKNPAYSRYGGRGITICPHWLQYENFRKDMGERPSLAHSLDRIDNNKGYEPGNCRWVTSSEQSRNRRDNVNITFEGATRCVAEWSEITGMNQATIRARFLVLKWSAEKVLTTPVKRRA